MGEFKKIETPEQLEDVLKPRLFREEMKHEKEAAALRDRIAELEKENQQLTEAQAASEKKYSGYPAELDELRAKVSGYEAAEKKREILAAAGLPDSFMDRLKGETPEEWAEDAQSMKQLFRYTRQTAPLADLPGITADNNPFREMLNNMKG